MNVGSGELLPVYYPHAMSLPKKCSMGPWWSVRKKAECTEPGAHATVGCLDKL